MGWHGPGLWLALSLLTALALLAARYAATGRSLQRIAAAHRLLIPYLALLAGAVSPRLMGLQQINWATSFSLGLGLTFGVLLLLALVRTVAVPALDRAGGADLGPVDVSAVQRPAAGGMRTAAALLLSAGLLEWHWAFLRGATWELALSYPQPMTLPGYWAIWLAAGFALVDLASDTAGAANWIVRLVALLITSILFFYTRNFWLCWLLHTGVQMILPPTKEPWRAH